MSDMDWQPADETQDLRPHLPECFAANPATPDASCLCPWLRACEARVTQRHNAEHEDDRQTAFRNGYADGLDGAKGAVRPWLAGESWAASALADIDALKDKP